MSVLGPDAEQAEVDVAAGGFMTPEGAPPIRQPPYPNSPPHSPSTAAAALGSGSSGRIGAHARGVCVGGRSGSAVCV